ncbi:hypothetical protein [Winogradskyella vidalii]|uniref:hypothetical protein n=1 Tax=Winogradskyella vidalii TaxID=2615024 RepID=UPI0015CEB0CB|nr:hypothetical protein [Winogradskyella vidalii]
MKVLFIIITLISSSLYAQNDQISGSYYQTSGNPEGGTTFIILPNHTFVVAYFGGARKGTWKLKAGDIYEFTYHTEEKHVLFGRTKSEDKDSVNVNIGVDEQEGIAIRFNAINKEPFIPLFNKGANCFSYPYHYKQKEQLKTLDISVPKERQYYKEISTDSVNIYSFKVEEDYNDFILIGLPETYSRPGSFIAKYHEGVLSLDENTNLKKGENYEDLNEETLNFAKSYTDTEILPQVLEYGNEFFPHHGEYPDKNDLKPFYKIRPVVKPLKDIVISENNLFTAKCDD